MSIDSTQFYQHNAGYEGVEAHLATLTTNVERNIMADDIILPQNSKSIPLTRGKFALVSEDDFERVNFSKWYFQSNGYAVRRTHCGYKEDGGRIQGLVYMHRFIMEAGRGVEVDHIDGNPLNNCRENLRLCTSRENKHNQRPQRGGISKYKGVTWQAGKYVAQIKDGGINIYLGRHSSEVAAARAYNEEAARRFGEFANLNVMEEAVL